MIFCIRSFLQFLLLKNDKSKNDSSLYWKQYLDPRHSCGVASLVRTLLLHSSRQGKQNLTLQLVCPTIDIVVLCVRFILWVCHNKITQCFIYWTLYSSKWYNGGPGSPGDRLWNGVCFASISSSHREIGETEFVLPRWLEVCTVRLGPVPCVQRNVRFSLPRTVSTVIQ